MSSERTSIRERAVAERARSLALRKRAEELRAQADRVSEALARSVGDFDGRPFGGRGESFALRVPTLPVMLRLVRQDLRRWLESRGLAGDDAADFMLAVSEACANAMEHPLSAAYSAIEIQAFARSGEIEVVVRDFGSWSAEGGEGERGRGLEMIRALMDHVTVEPDAQGTTVRMRRSLRDERRQDGRAGTITRT